MKLYSLTILLAATWVGLGATASGFDFEPDLGEAMELIEGGAPIVTTVPQGSLESTLYPLNGDRPLPLLDEFPGRPFRQVSPPPRALAWWKVPVYIGLGLPRDLVDSVFGFLANVPVVNIPIVWGAYEILPTQMLFRDHRDWHRWSGRRNALGHGMIDSVGWGWFPSAHRWQFTYPSHRRLAKNRAVNRELTEILREENRKIETRNRLIAEGRQRARSEALAAIEAGDGSEAVCRMIPYLNAYALDEGSFALLVSALALYRSDAPPWVDGLLWHQLAKALPRSLAHAQTLLTETALKHPDRPELIETLIYVRLLSGDPAGALEAAGQLPVGGTDPARRGRLIFETALSADDLDAALAARQDMGIDSAVPKTGSTTESSIDGRLALLDGRVTEALQIFADLQSAHPEDAYFSYYLGCAELALVESSEDLTAQVRRAFGFFERAVLLAPSTALRIRSGQALAMTRSLLVSLEGEGEPTLAANSNRP